MSKKKKFSVHTWVKRDLERVDFAPGDEVPAWAEDLVGEHTYAEPEVAASKPPEAEAEAEAVEVIPEPETAKEDPEAADFTRPATRRTPANARKK